MYSPKRKPSALVTAALENRKFQGFHVFVEGGSDFKLWRNFMQKRQTKVTICNGCDNVIEATVLGNEKGIRCFGIIDRDFRSILGSEELPDNVFITDDHDIELMISHCDSLGKVLNNYDSSQKIDDYEFAHGSVREHVLALTDQIGYLKLLHKRNDLNISLKKKDKDGDMELPNYERFLDQHCQIKSTTDMMMGTAMVFAPLILGMSVAMLEPLSKLGDMASLEGSTMIMNVYLIELSALISILVSSLGSDDGYERMLWRFCIICPISLIVFAIVCSIGL